MGHTKASAHAFHIRVMITGNHHNVHHPAATSYLVEELRSVHARIVQVQNCAIQSSPGFTVTPLWTPFEEHNINSRMPWMPRCCQISKQLQASETVKGSIQLLLRMLVHG